VLSAVALALSIVWAFSPALLYSLSNPGSPTSDNSTASLDVDLTIPVLFRISGISDLSFGTFAHDESTTKSLSDDVCVFTNDSSGQYRITAHGNGADSAFTLVKSGDATSTLPYAVYWNDESGTTGNFALTATVTHGSNLSGANTSSSSCLTGLSSTANFQVVLATSDILDSKAGNYTGTLTLTISAPE
jgi:hypothetical protein